MSDLSKLFVVEDHPVFREGLVQILNREKDFTVCGEADNASQAFRAITRLRPDLVLVDITLPGRSGLELIKELRAAQSPVKMLAVSMHDEALYATRVLRAGGHGYIMKNEDPDEIVHAVRAVLDGHIYVSEQVFARMQQPGFKERSEENLLGDLTDSELEILELLGQGKTNGQIARQFHMRFDEVAACCLRMQKKLKLNGTNALVRYAAIKLAEV